MVNVYDHARCLSLNNRTCMARPTLIDLNIDEYNQNFCLFMINLDSCNRRCIFFLMMHSVEYALQTIQKM